MATPKTLRCLALMLCALACVCAEEHTLGSAGEWSGPFYIVSTEGSRKPHEMIYLANSGDNGCYMSTWEFNEDSMAQWWLRVDRKDADDSISAWIVSTCESRCPDKAIRQDAMFPVWRYELNRGMLWDIVPVTGHADRFYIVSNPASSKPNEMLFIEQRGVLSWKFKEDQQAQWIFSSAPPTDCSPPEAQEGLTWLQIGWIVTGSLVGSLAFSCCLCSLPAYLKDQYSINICPNHSHGREASRGQATEQRSSDGGIRGEGVASETSRDI